MTCIVAVQTSNDSLVMGADSAAVGPHGDICTWREPKIFSINEKILVGITSSFRMQQILQYETEVKENYKNKPAMQYLIQDVVPSIRKSFDKHGWLWKENDRESGGVFLIGYQGNLFFMQSDFSIGTPQTPYYAVGSGEDVALGALSALVGDYKPTETEAQTYALTSLQSAEKHINSVRRPFTFFNQHSSGAITK